MRKPLTALLLALTLTFVSVPMAGAAESGGSAFERVTQTGTIRCGYIIYPPQLSKDPNTGTLSGLAYDLMERMGHDLNLKIEWTEEVGSGTWMEGLKNQRYDVLCNTAWATTIRAPHVRATVPAFFTAVNGYARTGDHRFDRDLSVANDPGIRIAALDGATSAAIAAELFPRASLVSLPELTDFSELLLNVSSGKADLTFSEAAAVADFEKKNPGLLHNVTPDRPVRLVQNAFFVAGDEHRLAAMLDTALENLHNDGFVDRILDRYEPAPGVWRRVALPYRPDR